MGDNLFKENPVILENPIKYGESGVEVKFQFDSLTKEDIHYDDNGYGIKPGCSCSANYVVTNEGIIISYNDNTDRSEVLRQSNKQLVVKKSITVYLNDGKDLHKKNDRGVKVKNKDKENVKLYFKVKVTV